MGLTLNNAQNALTQVGLVLGTTTSQTTSNSSQDQYVFSQSVNPGTVVTGGTAVNVSYYSYSASAPVGVSPVGVGVGVGVGVSPAQQDSIGSTSYTAYPNGTVTLNISGPQPLTNISVNGVNQTIFGALNASFTAPSSYGTYAIQAFDGEVPLLSAATLTVIPVPCLLYTSPSPRD